MEILKSKISSLCDSSNAPSKSALMHSNISQAVNLDTNSKRLKQMVIYQRDQSRKLGNEPEALQLLSKKFPPSQWSIEVLMIEIVNVKLQLEQLYIYIYMYISIDDFHDLI